LGFVARTRRPRATPTRARARERVVIRIIHPAHRTRAADVAARARASRPIHHRASRTPATSTHRRHIHRRPRDAARDATTHTTASRARALLFTQSRRRAHTYLESRVHARVDGWMRRRMDGWMRARASPWWRARAIRARFVRVAEPLPVRARARTA